MVKSNRRASNDNLNRMRLKPLYYGWVMVIISTVILAANAMVFYSFGVFLKPVTAEFNWDRGALSLAFSINFLLAGFLAIFVGRWADKYGPRFFVTANGLLTALGFFLLSQVHSLGEVYLIWGLPLSIAGSCSFIPMTSAIPRWFIAKKRALALSLTLSGFGIGGMVVPLLAEWLIADYGWRQAYIVLAVIILVLVTSLAQLMKTPAQLGLDSLAARPQASQSPVAPFQEGFSLGQAIRTGRFWLFSGFLFCLMFTSQMIFTHIVPHAVDIGLPGAMAASILSVFAVALLAGRLVVSFLGDKMGTRPTLAVGVVMAMVSLVWLLFASNTWMFYLFAVLWGVAWGGIYPMQMMLMAEFFGLKFLGIIQAALTFIGTVGGAAGAPLAGYIFDVTRSYRIAFLGGLVLCGMALVLGFILLFRRSGKSVTVAE
ncbi:MAG: MFS transporter [Chloroflexota bacterium]